MLPLITVGTQQFYDMSAIISHDRYARPTTDALVLHHTAGAQHFASRDAEIQHILMIEAQHLNAGYGGFGYNAIAFESGAVYVAGQGNGARAHVAGLNGSLEGIAIAGNYEDNPVPVGVALGVGRWLLAKFRQRGLKSFNGHRDYNPFIPAYYRSLCPGDFAMSERERMLRICVALAGAS